VRTTLPGALWILRDDDMIVGRTLWDFIIEVVRTPGLRGPLLALLVLLELAFILLLLLIQMGLIAVKLSYGGLGIELYHLAAVISWRQV
jgi:hypothetical protein